MHRDDDRPPLPPLTDAQRAAVDRSMAVALVEQLAAAEAFGNQTTPADQAAFADARAATGVTGQEIVTPTDRNGKYGRPRRVLKTIFRDPPMRVFAEQPSNLAYGEIRLRPGHVKMSLDTWQTAYADQHVFETLKREVEQYRGGTTVRRQIVDAGDYGRQRQAELDRLRATMQVPPGDLEDLRAQVDNLIIQLGTAGDVMTERHVAMFTERWLVANQRLDQVAAQLDELRSHLQLVARKLGPGA